MGRFVFRLPDVGEGIAEVELIEWHAAVGDTLAEDAPLVDVLTEKATVEIPTPRAGRVLSLAGKPGDKVRVGAEILVLETTANAVPEPEQTPAETSAPSPVPAPVVADTGREEERPSANEPPASKPRASPRAAPAVRNRARALGIALESLSGTGPGGRITHADLDAVLAGQRPSPAPAPRLGVPPGATGETTDDVEVIGLRRRIAERMLESKRSIPHYSYVEEIDVTPLEALRAELNAAYANARPHLTVLPFLIAALVNAVPQFPSVNATFDASASILHRSRAVDVGIATATRQGLLVPVVRHAEKRNLWQTAAEIARLTAAARDGKARREELSGSTITVSSLGPLGGIVATPIINPPEVAIVGVNRIVERPVVRNGRVAVRRMMNLSSSFDHRIVDGAEAARFIHELKRLLEQPALLFLP